MSSNFEKKMKFPSFFFVTLLVSTSLSSSDEEVCDVKESGKIGVLRPEDLPSEMVYQDWSNSTIQLSGKVRRALFSLSLSLSLASKRTIRVMILS